MHSCLVIALVAAVVYTTLAFNAEPRIAEQRCGLGEACKQGQCCQGFFFFASCRDQPTQNGARCTRACGCAGQMTCSSSGQCQSNSNSTSTTTTTMMPGLNMSSTTTTTTSSGDGSSSSTTQMMDLGGVPTDFPTPQI